MGVIETSAKKKTGPKPKPEGPRDAMIAVKCRKPYKQWAGEFAQRERSTPSSLVDVALFELAKARGFDLPPNR